VVDTLEFSNFIEKFIGESGISRFVWERHSSLEKFGELILTQGNERVKLAETNRGGREGIRASERSSRSASQI
jgi:hypothetical protein